MTEHLIRLRGGWQCDPSIDEGVSSRFVTLPLHSPMTLSAPLRLIRWFGSPRFDLDHERILLRMEHIEGLAIARLNDREIARPSPGTANLVLSLDEQLLARNQLVLEIDSFPSAPRDSDDFTWGKIALAIVPRTGIPVEPRGDSEKSHR